MSNKIHAAGIASVFLVILGLLCLPVSVSAVESIKFATLAPKGSTWMNNFDAMAKEISTKTDRQIKFRFYANGIQGDELDVIRKMRAGLLHAGAMTATGLGEIQKEVLIFQLPRLFKTYEELDYVRNYLQEDLKKAFLDAGYILIGMGDIGFYYIFSNHPIRTIADLQSPNVKMWARTTDKIALEFYNRAKIATVPREVSQVLPSLHSGHLNAVTVSPYVTVALQWYPKLKYMTSLPVSVGVGATVITKEKFDQLTADQQKVLWEAGDKYQSMLIESIRKDNETALEALTQRAGIKIVEFQDSARDAWDAIAAETHNALVGQIYSQEFLDKINALLREYREKK
jgi:TRAP-type C4-dicarboxylate transport system substrate-binding protein